MQLTCDWPAGRAVRIVSAMSPIVCAALIVMFEGLNVTSVFPVVHEYAQQLGGSAMAVGLLFALVPAAKILSNPIWGRLSDRLGRRPTLAIITSGTMAGSIGWALAPNIWVLGVARVLTGAFAAQAAVAYAIAADTSTRARRAASMAILGAGFAIAMTVGPLVGGLLGRFYGPASVGWFCASMQACSLVVILALLRETSPHTGKTAGEHRVTSSWALMSRRPVLLLLLATLLMTIGFSELTSTLGLFTEHAYRFDTAKTGYLFALVGIVAAVIQGGGVRAIVRRLGETRTVLIGLGLLTVGFAWAGTQPALGGFIAAVTLMAAGGGLVMPTLSAMLSHVVSEDDQGAVQGLSQSSTGLGRAIGFYLGGALFGLRGPGLAYGLAAAAVLLAALFVWPARHQADHAAAPARSA